MQRNVLSIYLIILILHRGGVANKHLDEGRSLIANVYAVDLLLLLKL